MTEPMKLTAEEIIDLINREIEWTKADIDEQGAQIATEYDLSSPMNNSQYNILRRAIEIQQSRHNYILHMQTILNHIQAAEEMKRNA